MKADYPERADYAERKTYADTSGARCPKCGGRAPSRVCRRCGRLPRTIRTDEGYRRELER